MGKGTHCALGSHLVRAFAIVIIFLLCVLVGQLSRGANWCHILCSLQCAWVTSFSASEPLHVPNVAGLKCCREIWSKSDSPFGNAYLCGYPQAFRTGHGQALPSAFSNLGDVEVIVKSCLPGVFIPCMGFPALRDFGMTCPVRTAALGRGCAWLMFLLNGQGQASRWWGRSSLTWWR